MNTDGLVGRQTTADSSTDDDGGGGGDSENDTPCATTPRCSRVVTHNTYKYPPVFPPVPPHRSDPSWGRVPFAPELQAQVDPDGRVTLQWHAKKTFVHVVAAIKEYELFVCRERAQKPHQSMWKLVAVFYDNPLPIRCYLETSRGGHAYHIGVRAVDVYDRRAPMSVVRVFIRPKSRRSDDGQTASKKMIDLPPSLR